MPIAELNGKRPAVHNSTFMAPTAWVIGDVRIEAGVSIWFNAVLRGEWASILVGEGSNVQDCAVIHPDRRSAIIGKRVTMGHGSIVEGAIVEDEVMLGIRSTILEGARVGRGSVIAAGSLVPSKMEIPPGSFVAGSPAKVVGRVKAGLVKLIHEGWRGYSKLKEDYRTGLRTI